MFYFLGNYDNSSSSTKANFEFFMKLKRECEIRKKHQLDMFPARVAGTDKYIKKYLSSFM